MKKATQNLSIIMLICMVAFSPSVTAKTKKDPYHFIVEGAILAQKNISYTVFKMDNKSGDFVSESHCKIRKHFSVMCDVGFKYIVRFQDKKGNVKFLMLDVTRNGSFTVDVDFTTPWDGLLKYTPIGYRLTRINNGLKASPLAKYNGGTNNSY